MLNEVVTLWIKKLCLDSVFFLLTLILQKQKNKQSYFLKEDECHDMNLIGHNCTNTFTP